MAAAAHPPGHTPPAAPASPPGSVVRAHDPWTTIGKLDLLGRIVAAGNNLLPGFEHAISAAVVGGPEADIRRCWYLALALAFGKYRDSVSGSYKSMSFQGTWNITEKSCTVELAYRTSKWENLATEAITLFSDGVTAIAGVFSSIPASKGANPRKSPYTFLHAGPQQLTIGGSWPAFLTPGNPAIPEGMTPSWSALLPCKPEAAGVNINVFRTYRMGDIFREFPILSQKSGVLTSALFSWYPLGWQLGVDASGNAIAGYRNGYGVPVNDDGNSILPDSNRVILTAEKTDFRVQPPTPPNDGHTRADLMTLVAQSLTTPCFLPEQPICTSRPAGTAGVYVNRPGVNRTFDGIASDVAGQRSLEQVFRSLSTDAPDGLVTPRILPTVNP